MRTVKRAPSRHFLPLTCCTLYCLDTVLRDSLYSLTIFQFHPYLLLQHLSLSPNRIFRFINPKKLLRGKRLAQYFYFFYFYKLFVSRTKYLVLFECPAKGVKINSKCIRFLTHINIFFSLNFGYLEHCSQQAATKTA
jgi:hypothetical protein